MDVTTMDVKTAYQEHWNRDAQIAALRSEQKVLHDHICLLEDAERRLNPGPAALTQGMSLDGDESIARFVKNLGAEAKAKFLAALQGGQ